MEVRFLDFFFKQKSFDSEAFRTWVNTHCGIPMVEQSHGLKKCGIRYLDSLTAASSYGHPELQAAIRAWKYGHQESLTEIFTAMFTDFYAPNDAVLCPVPLHWTRRLQRGFNQSAVLAESIADQKHLNVAHVLQRKRATGHQAWRKREDRLTALENAFQFSSKDVPAHVILIDDLATTGATLDACAKALKDAGVTRVDAWVIARA